MLGLGALLGRAATDKGGVVPGGLLVDGDWIKMSSVNWADVNETNWGDWDATSDT